MFKCSSEVDSRGVVVVDDAGVEVCGRMAAGGYRARNLVNRGGRDCASLIYWPRCIVAMVKVKELAGFRW